MGSECFCHFRGELYTPGLLKSSFKSSKDHSDGALTLALVPSASSSMLLREQALSSV